MHARLTLAALTRRPGMVALAVAAVAIGASVAAALLHVSGDVERKLTRELRVLGPNLTLLPDDAGTGLLDERAIRARLARLEGIAASPQFELTALAGAAAAPVIGADHGAVRRLHPSWRTVSAAPGGGGASGAMGARLAARLGARAGEPRTLSFPESGESLAVRIAEVFESGTVADEAVIVPLDAAQRLAGRPGALTSVELRVAGDAARAAGIGAALEQGGGARARVRFALSRTEADLLERMRRLMTLVTVAALVSAGLCAFGTLTDLALERRREIGLLQALGATRLEIVRQFALESLAIGVAGGALGWVVGAAFAQVIGRRVFDAPIALQPGVPLVVMGLALLVAVAAGLGPIRLALRVDPARVLKGD